MSVMFMTHQINSRTLCLLGKCISDRLNFLPISWFRGVAPIPSNGSSGIVFSTSFSISSICCLFISVGFLDGSRPFCETRKGKCSVNHQAIFYIALDPK